MTNPASGVLTLEQVQAEKLAGREWVLDGVPYRFADFVGPGQPPWESGSEGIAYPLLRPDGTAGAYAKFFESAKISQKRIERTRWLIDQRVDTWAPGLRSAPHAWIDTRRIGRPRGVEFDFICSLAQAAPGSTWALLRFDMKDGVVHLDAAFRRRCAESLVRSLVVLERKGLVHGDLSCHNVIIDKDADKSDPPLFLIDFDAFFAPDAGHLAQLSIGEGGTYGTSGYCPPELEQRASPNSNAAPYSDRFARDFLLLELLCFDADCDEEEPASTWPIEKIRTRLDTSGVASLVPHLASESVFHLSEEERPSALDVAHMLHLPVPPPIKRRGRPTGKATATPHRKLAWDMLLQAAVLLLWFLCAAHWSVISYRGSGWLIDVEPTDIAALGPIPLAVRFAAAGGLLLGGLFPLSCLAFAEPQSRIVAIGPLRLEIPPRRNRGRSKQAEQAMTALQLTGILAVLVIAVLIVVRFA